MRTPEPQSPSLVIPSILAQIMPPTPCGAGRDVSNAVSSQTLLSAFLSQDPIPLPTLRKWPCVSIHPADSSGGKFIRDLPCIPSTDVSRIYIPRLGMKVDRYPRSWGLRARNRQTSLLAHRSRVLSQPPSLLAAPMHPLIVRVSPVYTWVVCEFTACATCAGDRGWKFLSRRSSSTDGHSRQTWDLVPAWITWPLFLCPSLQTQL